MSRITNISLQALKTQADEAPGSAIVHIFAKCGGGSVEQVDYPTTHLAVTDAPRAIIDKNPYEALPFGKEALDCSVSSTFQNATEALTAMEPKMLRQLEEQMQRATAVNRPLYLVGKSGAVLVTA